MSELNHVLRITGEEKQQITSHKQRDSVEEEEEDEALVSLSELFLKLKR